MFGDLFETLAVPLLQDNLGEDIIQWPGGDSDSACTVTAIVGRGSQTRRQDRGISNPSSTHIDVAAALTVLPTDRWRIDSITWNTLHIDPADAGLRRIELINPKQQTTTHPTRDLMTR